MRGILELVDSLVGESPCVLRDPRVISLLLCLGFGYRLA